MRIVILALAGFVLFFCPVARAWTSAGHGLSETNSWSLSSPDGKCEICVSLDGNRLSYFALYRGKVVIQRSPLGLQRDDQDFQSNLAFGHAGEIYSRREQYELYAGIQPRIDHLLNHRHLVFRNTNRIALEIELAAGTGGVAFRYHFGETNGATCVVKSESTGFKLPLNATGWLQPYHAAGPYTPAYEDFYFHVSPAQSPPESRAKPRGWAFPALFRIPDPGVWALLTESGTDDSYCGCHLDGDSSGGLYHIAFPLADEATKGFVTKVGPEPRNSLPWTMPWRVIVLGESAGEIALQTLVTDLAPPSAIPDTA